MPLRVGLSSLLLLASAAMAAACNGDPAVTEARCCATGTRSLRVVNGFTTPLQVTIDGYVATASLAAGAIDAAASASGSHTVVLRPVLILDKPRGGARYEIL